MNDNIIVMDEEPNLQKIILHIQNLPYTLRIL